MTQTHSTSVLQATIDRIEDDQVVFYIEKKEFIVPKQFLPTDIKEGTVLQIYITLDSNAEMSKEQLAKTILNDILHPSYEEKKQT